MALKPCRECAAQVSTEAKTCPHCGIDNPATATSEANVPQLGVVDNRGTAASAPSEADVSGVNRPPSPASGYNPSPVKVTVVAVIVMVVLVWVAIASMPGQSSVALPTIDTAAVRRADSLQAVKDAAMRASVDSLVDAKGIRNMTLKELKLTSAWATSETTRQGAVAAIGVAKRNERITSIYNSTKGAYFNDGSPCTRATKSAIKALVTKYPAWPNGDVSSAACGAVRVGMTAEVMRESWGRPNSINSSTYSFGVREQWVYGSGRYVYLEDGVVSSYQLSR